MYLGILAFYILITLGLWYINYTIGGGTMAEKIVRI